MRTFLWPAEDGWPYPDTVGETVDLDAEVDTDLLSLQVPAAVLLAGLDPLERRVVAARYGLGGEQERSVAQLVIELGLPATDVQAVLGSGLGKLREQLA